MVIFFFFFLLIFIIISTINYNPIKEYINIDILSEEDKKNKDKVVKSIEEAIQGALDIIAEDISDNAYLKYHNIFEQKEIDYRIQVSHNLNKKKCNSLGILYLYIYIL